MALIVRLYVNHEHIGTSWARRIKGGEKPADRNIYILDDGTILKHTYGDGAAKLAEKMMKHLYEKSRSAKWKPLKMQSPKKS